MGNVEAVVVEQLLVGKHSQEKCEDGIVANSNYIAVIDGSTSKTNSHYHPLMSNGKYAMSLVAQFIERASAHLTLEAFCKGLTEHVHAAYPDQGSEALHAPEKRLCASVVVYAASAQAIWMIGDCQCMVDGVLYDNPKPYEEGIARRRSELFPQMVKNHPDMIADGHIARDYAREAVLGQLVASMQGENVTYAVVDGFDIFKQGIKVIPLSEPPHDIVLASDGYPWLRPTLAESERLLAQQQSNDPYNIGSFKATKGLMRGNVSFDDRAYIHFKLRQR